MIIYGGEGGTANGGAGGAAVISGGNAGGVGATLNDLYTSITNGIGSGSDGFVKIYRGNTNIVSE